MSKLQNIHMFIKLNCDEVNCLKNIAQDRYGKASISLLAKKLLQEQIRLPDYTDKTHQESAPNNQRLVLRLPSKQRAYLTQKATLQHSSLNDIVRDIIAEHITDNPVLSNDEVQALYQSNYQLLRIGRNINQLARQFNATLPQSLTTQQLNALSQFIEQHTNQVGKVLKKQNKRFKYRPTRDLNYETAEQTN